MWVRKLFPEQKTIDSNYKLFSISSASLCRCSQLSTILVLFINFSNMIRKRNQRFNYSPGVSLLCSLFFSTGWPFFADQQFYKGYAHAQTKLKWKILLKRINQNPVNQPLTDHFEQLEAACSWFKSYWSDWMKRYFVWNFLFQKVYEEVHLHYDVTINLFCKALSKILYWIQYAVLSSSRTSNIFISRKSALWWKSLCGLSCNSARANNSA